MKQQKALILGNGASMRDYTTPPDGVYIIGTNRWYERTPVHAVSAVDNYQVQHIQQNLHHSIPLWTRQPWARQFNLQCPVGATTQEISGSLAIRVAAQLGHTEIHCVGFDAYLWGTSSKLVQPPKRRPRLKPPEFWRTAVDSAVASTTATVIFHPNYHQFLHMLNMHNGDSNS